MNKTKQPTDFREKIEEILEQFYKDELPDKACKGILSAVSELVRECKPNSSNKDSFWQKAIDEYEKNLLEALQ